MSAISVSIPLASSSRERRPVIPSGVLGMLAFVACEVMFFAALISARFVVSSASEAWPPAGQPRLPIATTAANTLILLASGCLLFFANRAHQKGDATNTKKLLGGSLGLGALFVIFQGMEWMRLVGYGLTMQSSHYGSFFYLIIGAHAAHAIIALAVLGWALAALARNELKPTHFWAVQVFWYFVVGLWPFLYVLVYLL